MRDDACFYTKSFQTKSDESEHTCVRYPTPIIKRHTILHHAQQPNNECASDKCMTERIWKICTFGNDSSETWVLAHPFNGVHVQQIVNGGGVVVILVVKVSMDRGDARHGRAHYILSN